jgi:hypothetical protein
MPIPVACPSCRHRLRIPENLAGRRVTCPRCNHPLEAPAAEEAPPEPATAAPSPEAEPRPCAPLPLATRLGIAALALGLVAVLVLCLPIVGFASPALSGAGLLCGLGGLFSSLARGVRKGSGLAAETAGPSYHFGDRAVDFPLAGSALCILALGLALVPFFLS